MATTNYYTIGGQIMGEKTAGSSRVDYLTDALGSVTGTVDQSAAVVNTYRYKPYGGLLAKTGAGSDPAFQWVGSQGYRNTGKSFADIHVRARHYSSIMGRWTTLDPLRIHEIINRYGYVKNDPISRIDPTGLIVKDTCSILTQQANIFDKIPFMSYEDWLQTDLSDRGIMGITYCKPFGNDISSRVFVNMGCATKCLKDHEQVHVTLDRDCCKLFQKQYRNAPIEPVCRRWARDYVTPNMRYSECKAYRVSFDCADSLWKSNECDQLPPPMGPNDPFKARRECCGYSGIIKQASLGELTALQCKGLPGGPPAPTPATCPFPYDIYGF
ncbi:MAG: RHS repeat-associated core domain-containing protein [Armatimonadetes bacterium]|nr:RHS repeat-associated core domain-containing protein [Armatimonadota bacterium]